jgi:type I restriction enzyme S subunit
VSEWREVALGEVIELKRGYDLPTADRQPGSVPIVSSSGRTGFHDTAKVKGPGVVTGRYGTLGEVFYIEEDFWPLNTSLYVRDFKGNDPRFVAALLSSLDLGRREGAAAVPGVNRNHLHTIPVSVPNAATQHRISVVLSAIDDLIENNRRRIALLEQMAQAIYREWFVHFRYPGHEHDELVDSPLGPIPAGWEARPFAELASFLNGFAFKPEHWGSSGLPIIKIKELKEGVTPSTPRYDGDDIPARFLVSRGDLLFSWSGHLDAYLWPWGPGLLNQHLFMVESIDGAPRTWLFLSLRERMEEFRSRSQGTTMKHIKRAALNEVRAVTPPSDLLAMFEGLASPIAGEVLALSASTANAIELRDLLLPKLVTGAIDVSRLDLDTLLADEAS